LRSLRPVDLDVTGADPEGAFTEESAGPQGADPAVAPHVGTGRHVDLHVDRLAATAEGVQFPPPGRLDRELAVGVLDPGVLGGGDVGFLGRVAGAYLDDGVGAIGGDDADVGDAEFQRDGNGFGRIERGHGGSFNLAACTWGGSESGSADGRG
jgi:hypothetical protein